MAGRLEMAEALTNSIAAKIPLVDKNDLATLGEIIQHLEQLSSDAEIPRAFKGLAVRAAKLVEHIVMGEIPFDSGVAKLGQALEKMQAAVADLRARQVDTDREERGETAAASQGQSEDLGDLLARFASKQQSVLEDFEAAALAYEKGSQDSGDLIRRILHTWKGEFGVLGMQAYCSLLHQVEERFLEGQLEVEALLRLNDFLGQKLGQIAAGRAPEIGAGEMRFVLGPSEDGEGEEEESGDGEERPEEEGAVGADESVPTSGERAFEGDPTLMGDFVAESREHLDQAEPLLLELENDPGDYDRLNSIFRACHTIKGIAGFLGLREVNQLSHSIENLMDLARKRELVLGPGHIDVLLEAVDCLRQLVDAVEATLGGGEFVVPSNYEEIRAKLATPYESGGRSISYPLPSGRKTGEILVERGLVNERDVEEALRKQQQGDERKIGQILMAEGKARARSVAGALASQNAAKQVKSVEETIRVPVQRLDQLIDAIGEAVIAQSMVYADPAVSAIGDLRLRNKMAQAGLIMREIQELSMSLRMVTIRGVFQKMARLVRDLSKKFGKEVELVTEGDDTELDKSVVENIGDPLMHMIRNAVDHGIESPGEREAAGKAAQAKVSLRAYHKAGSVFIEVEDDGRGLDRDKILAKAIKVGLVKDAEGLGDQDIYRLVFAPGFSTAEKVTDVSGRGVGMDVVRKNIEALRGAVDITSEAGRGTLFTIRLPLTLAIIDGMVIRLGTDRYIVPALSIIESIRPESDQVERIVGKGEIIKVRGELLRLIRLKDVFGGYETGESAQDCIAIVVEDVMGRRVGLLVDEILDQQQVVIKSLGEGLGEVTGVAGGAIMNDGSVSLILDVGGVVKMANE